jgi:hypothetical protein
MDIINNPPKPNKSKLTQQQINEFLSVVSTYGRGAEAAMTRYMQISKGLKNHLVKGEYKKEVEQFLKLTDEEVDALATSLFDEKNLQQFCTQTIKKNKHIMRPL